MEQIRELYIKMYQYMIDKNKDGLEDVLDDSFILTHMTGMKQPKEIYVESILDGTLNYYTVEHENIKIDIKENEAHLVGDSYVEVKVFGGGRSHWRLRQSMNLIKKNEKWYFTSSKASVYSKAYNGL